MEIPETQVYCRHQYKNAAFDNRQMKKQMELKHFKSGAGTIINPLKEAPAQQRMTNVTRSQIERSSPVRRRIVPGRATKTAITVGHSNGTDAEISSLQ